MNQAGISGATRDTAQEAGGHRHGPAWLGTQERKQTCVWALRGAFVLVSQPVTATWLLVVVGGWSPLTEGTRSPCSMMSRISLLLSDSEASSWCRSSPVERWVNPYFSTSFSHWVLLPEPGPPWDTPDKHLETTAFFWGTQKLFLLMDIHCVK